MPHLARTRHRPLSTQRRGCALSSRNHGLIGRQFGCGVSSRQIRRAYKSSRIEALDAAQSFDFEAKAQAKLKEAERQKLRIGIIGFGNFGQFLAKRFLKQGHEVLATSRQPYEEVAAKLGVLYFRDVNDFCEEHPDVVILSTSIMSTEKVLGAIPMQRLRRNTLFVDVLSVKVFPKQLLLSRLHPQMDVLCTHPMFGPDSGKGSWEGLNFMYEKVRLLPGVQRERRINSFLQCFADEGCHMVEMTCEEHDRQSAGTQFITHTVGRILGEMNLQSTAINTKGFESLLSLVNNTTNDSFDLYYGLFMYNQNSTRELENMEQAFLEVKQKLFSELHATLRKEVFPSTPSPALPPSPASAADTAHGNGKAGASGSGSGGEGADGASEGLQEAATGDRGVAVEKR